MIAIYARQSVDKKDSISIESQIDFCKKEFEEGQAYKTYIDEGFSGKDTNRPAFEKLINDVKEGQINKIIVYKLVIYKLIIPQIGDSLQSTYRRKLKKIIAIRRKSKIIYCKFAG